MIGPTRRRKKVWIFALLIAVMVAAGCEPPQGSVFRSSDGRLHVSPSPPTKTVKPYAIACDIRAVRVADGSVLGSATGEAKGEKIGALAEALAGKVREAILIKGETIAVVSLRNRSGTKDARVVADELADKLTGALVSLNWFKVKERLDLRAILDEKDLGEAAVVKNDAVKKKLTNVKYVVVGAVTVTETKE